MSKIVSVQTLQQEKVSRGTQLGQLLLPWLFPIGFFLLFYNSSTPRLFKSRILPAPTAVVTAFWHLLLSGELWKHVQVSAGRALLGLLVGGGLGLFLGLLNGSWKTGSTRLDTTLQLIRNIQIGRA